MDEQKDHLKVVEDMLKEALTSPRKVSRESFMKAYNSIYKICTDETNDRYVIKGGHVYHLYDRLLIATLGSLPSEFTLKELTKYLMSYKRSIDLVYKMMSFLSRYFIRVNVEVKNTNIRDLLVLSYNRLYELLIEPNSPKIQKIFFSEIRETRSGIGVLSKMEENSEKARAVKHELFKKERIINSFLSEYLITLELNRSNRTIKRFYSRWSDEILGSVEETLSPLPADPSNALWYKALRTELSVVNGIFERETELKKHLYRKLIRSIGSARLKSAISLFNADLFQGGSMEELCPFFLLMDNLTKGEGEFFKRVFISSLRREIAQGTTLPALLTLLTHTNRALKQMRLTERKVKKDIEAFFSYRIREIVSEEEKDKQFVKSLLGAINASQTASTPRISELSLFASNITREEKAFWTSFVDDLKFRMVCLDTKPEREKEMVVEVFRKIEKCKDNLMYRDDLPPKEVPFEPMCYSHFEDLHTCFNDVTTSAKMFRNTEDAPHKDTKLLSYNRWSYRKLNINLEPEFAKCWEELLCYCKSNGKRYLLDLCPEMSRVELDLHGTPLLLNVIDANILLLLIRTEAPRDDLKKKMSMDLLNTAYSTVIDQSITKLIDANVLIEASTLSINPASTVYKATLLADGKLDLFFPFLKREVCSLSEQTSKMDQRYPIECLIVREMKTRKISEAKDLFNAVSTSFNVTMDMFESYLLSLKDKGLLEMSDGSIIYVP